MLQKQKSTSSKWLHTPRIALQIRHIFYIITVQALASFVQRAVPNMAWQTSGTSFTFCTCVQASCCTLRVSGTLKITFASEVLKKVDSMVLHSSALYRHHILLLFMMCLEYQKGWLQELKICYHFGHEKPPFFCAPSLLFVPTSWHFWKFFFKDFTALLLFINLQAKNASFQLSHHCF